MSVRSGLLCMFLGLALSACRSRPQEGAEAVRPASSAPVEVVSAVSEYVGSARCAGCHAEAHESWLGSHHALSMQEANADTIVGDFKQGSFRYFKERIRFVETDGSYYVEALDAEGRRSRFPVRYTFGAIPLQQLLVETAPGRLQSFPVAWDSRPKNEGGQRWFHLQPDEYIGPGDPLHWTGHFYNWNNACADCHSTSVEKNYDRQTRAYTTVYEEINVGCEACHGAGSAHVIAMESQSVAPGLQNGGFAHRLVSPDARKWRFSEDQDIARLVEPTTTDELDTCAPCHSRRSELGGRSDVYHDGYRLAPLDEFLYFDDGQIEDEVFVYGSFLQSKMYAAGVVCSDCHESHGPGLRAQGNALCTRCHKAEVFDGPGHSFHQPGIAGSQCVDCHMPKRTYMVLDERGDHRFGLPRPALSARVGSPNACNGCHADKTPAWAERQIAAHFKDRAPPHGFAEAFHAARHQQPGSEEALVELIAVGAAPAIVRATALLELRNVRSQALPSLVMRAAADPSPIVRQAAAASAREMPPALRRRIALPLLGDPSRSVRIEAAGAFLGDETADWRPSDRQAFDAALAEYREAREHMADRGEGLVELAHLAMVDGKPGQAEAILQEALATDPTFTAAYVNLGDLYRGLGRQEESEAVLRRGLEKSADEATAEHALGLALVRLGRYDEALVRLRRAYFARPQSVRFGYVYSVAAFDRGQGKQAMKTLDALHRRYPGNVQVLTLLARYSQELGLDAEARKYVGQLEALGVRPQ